MVSFDPDKARLGAAVLAHFLGNFPWRNQGWVGWHGLPSGPRVGRRASTESLRSKRLSGGAQSPHPDSAAKSQRLSWLGSLYFHRSGAPANACVWAPFDPRIRRGASRTMRPAHPGFLVSGQATSCDWEKAPLRARTNQLQCRPRGDRQC